MSNTNPTDLVQTQQREFSVPDSCSTTLTSIDEPVTLTCSGGPPPPNNVFCDKLGYGLTPMPKPTVIHMLSGDSHSGGRVVKPDMVQWVPCHDRMALVQVKTRGVYYTIPMTWQLVAEKSFSKQFTTHYTLPSNTPRFPNSCIAWFTVGRQHDLEAQRIARDMVNPNDNAVDLLFGRCGFDWYLVVFPNNRNQTANMREWVDAAEEAAKLNWNNMPCNSQIVPNGYLGNACQNKNGESLNSSTIWQVFRNLLSIQDPNGREAAKKRAIAVKNDSGLDMATFDIRCEPPAYYPLPARAFWEIIKNASRMAQEDERRRQAPRP